MIEYGVVLFFNISSVMRAEKLLKKEYSIKLIPIPRQFSTDCGIALRFDWSQSVQVKSVLDEAKLEISAVRFLGTKEF
jgi:hypothetical protein